MRTEYEANLALQRKPPAAWQTPSRCKRPQPSTLRRILRALFGV